MHLQAKEKSTKKRQKRNTQVVMKVPTLFMERFDRIAETLGYTRTEAIKESMRRFEEWGEKRLMERPETAAENMRQMMEAMFKPLIEMASKQEEAEGGKIVEVKNKAPSRIKVEHAHARRPGLTP